MMRVTVNVECDGEHYQIFKDQVIAGGAYSTVYRGRTKAGKPVAVKDATRPHDITAMINEIDILKRLKDVPNIVQLIGSEMYREENNYRERCTFAMELAICSLESKMKEIENFKGLPMDMIIDLVSDTASAVKALHEKKIAHRDIKNMNILLFPGLPNKERRSKYIFKLCDLGCAAKGREEMSTLMGTPNALLPIMAIAHARNQYQTDKTYTSEQCDLWSFGCALYYCATGSPAFKYDSSQTKMYSDAVQMLREYPDSIGMRYCGRVECSVPGKSKFKFEPINELSSRYPKWLNYTLTTLIRNFFHTPNIQVFAEIANSLKTAKRRTFYSIDQLSILHHSDLSNDCHIGAKFPSLQSCLGYSEKTTLQLISMTSIRLFDTNEKRDESRRLKELSDENYLVVPNDINITIQAIPKGKSNYKQSDEYDVNKLKYYRECMIFDGYNYMKQADVYIELFQEVLKILSTRYSLFIEKLRQNESIQITTRFGMYLNSTSLIILMIDNERAREESRGYIKTSERCLNELETHMRNFNKLENLAKEHKKKVDSKVLNDVDLPGIIDELKSLDFNCRQDILDTREYALELVDKCLKRRDAIVDQILPANANDKLVKELLDSAACLNQWITDYNRLQKNVEECVELIEKPFQHIKRMTEHYLKERNLDYFDLELIAKKRSEQYLEAQKSISESTKATRKMIYKLDDAIKNLRFVRMGDTLVMESKSNKERNLGTQTIEELNMRSGSSVSTNLMNNETDECFEGSSTIPKQEKKTKNMEKLKRSNEVNCIISVNKGKKKSGKKLKKHDLSENGA